MLLIANSSKIWIWHRFFSVRLKTIFKNKESCITDAQKTKKYFKLERGAWKGNPTSAYLFILVLEIFFIFVENNPKVKGFKIFRY